jgi:hypothetical protein
MHNVWAQAPKNLPQAGMRTQILTVIFVQSDDRDICPLNAIAEISGISKAYNGMTITVRRHIID